MRVAIVKYNAGNVGSVANALERIGAECIVTDDERELLSAERVIFPGVGEASSAMAYLQARGLHEIIPSIQAPLLGICLGLQLLSSYSEENSCRCLGVVQGDVVRFRNAPKVPHTGWSRIRVTPHPLFTGIPDGSFFYFVHSYRLGVGDHTVASCDYFEEFSAAIAKGNFLGVQFHPERSGAVGERLLMNFLDMAL